MVEIHRIESQFDGRGKGIPVLSIVDEQMRQDYIFRGEHPVVERGVRVLEERVGKTIVTEIRNVLLVDDEKEFVQTLSERLQMRGIRCTVAYDGESALACMAAEEPAVMVLDLRMPGIGGLDVLRQAKRETPQMEVIILTGHGSTADKEICLALGAFDYFQKPVDIELLSSAIKRAAGA